MLLLALRNLRARPVRTLFTAFAIALGVALIFATRIVGVAAEAVSRQIRADQLAGADLEITSSTGARFNVNLIGKATAVSGVEAAAPILRAGEGTASHSTQLLLLGVDVTQPLRPYELASGSFFSAPDALEVLLPLSWAALNGVGVGDEVQLTTNLQTHDYRVAGLLKESGLPGAQPVAWLPLGAMQTAYDLPAEVSAILVRLNPGARPETVRAALQAALGPTYIVAGSETGASGEDIFEVLSGAALPFASVIVVLAGAFFVYNALAITLAERRREIGQLRALGLTRGQTLALTLAEALLVALLGSALGLLLGFGLGQVMTALVKAEATRAPLDGVVFSAGVGILVTLAVAYNLARRSSRVSPLTALRSSATTDALRSRTSRWPVIGLLLCLALFALAQWATIRYLQNATDFSRAFFIAFLPPFLLGGAMLFVLPLVMRLALPISERFAARWGVAARLAVGSLARQPGRAALTAITLTIGLMLVVSLAGLSQALFTAFDEEFTPVAVQYDFAFVREAGPSGALPPVPSALQRDLEALAAEAEIVRFNQIGNPGGPVFETHAPNAMYVGDIALFSRAAIFRAVEGSWDEAARYFAAGPALAIPEITSRRLDLHPGDTVMVETFEGQVAFKVAVVSKFFLFTPEDGARYLHVNTSSWLVRARGGVDKDALREKSRTLASAHHLQFIDDLSRVINDTFGVVFNSLFALFGGLTSISGIIAGLGIANTLVASVLERQRELGTLRALGLTQAQVRILVLLEAGLLGLIGALVGVVGGLGMNLASLQLFGYILAWMGYQPLRTLPLPWGMAALALGVGPALSMLAALWPADRAASVNPAEAMRAEGATGFLPPARHLGPTGLRGLVVRMPLAAKLSFSLGLVFVLTLALTTWFRVNDERRLLADNMRAILQRGFDLFNLSTRDAFGADVTELTPQLLVEIQRQAGVQIETLTAQHSDSPYEFTLKYIFITDPGHKVLLSDRAEFGGRVLTDTVSVNGSAALVRETSWMGIHAFEVVVPIENGAGRRLGLARLGLSAEPVDNVIRDIQRNSAWTAIAALAVAVTLTVLLTRRALAPMAQVVAASRAVARGDLARRVPESRWDDVGQLARAFNDMVKGLNERERMRDLFGRYLSREVGEAVLAGRVSLKGERKTITVLYCDMRGSTTFAEQHAPEDVMAALNQYFEVIILATEAHGGIVNRFVGDEAVCVFGAPTEVRDHAERAVQAALSMREGLAYVNQKRTALGQPVLKFGMGLNTGEVTAGATGSEERQEYTVIGDAMNVGARIQGLTRNFPEQDILLSEFTHAALGPNADAYALADLGPVEIRGKTQPVRVFGLVRSKT